MTSVPSPAAPLPFPPLGSGPVGLPSFTAGGELFSREVARAVERQGGERAIESRAAELSSARRTGRSAGFDGYRARLGDGSDREPEAGDAPPAGPSLAPREDARASNKARDAALPRSGGEGARTDVAQDPGGGSPRASEGGPALEAPAGATPVAGVAPSGPAAASAGPPSAVRAAAPAAQGPPAVPGLESARGPRGPQTAVENARPGAAPDPAGLAEAEEAATVLRQIRLSLSGGASHVAIDLDPEELGRLWIRMSLRDGQLTARVRADSPQTLELLERQAPELRAALAQHGFDAEHLDLELSLADRREGRARDFAGAFGGRGASSHDSAPTEDVGAERRIPIHLPAALRAGGIDTYA